MAGQAAALPKSSNMSTLSQPKGADYAHPMAFPCPKKFCDYAPDLVLFKADILLLSIRSLWLLQKGIGSERTFWLREGDGRSRQKI